jgi:hypothetical protein
MVERPLVRFDETMPIAADTYFALHPAFSTPASYSWICDDFLLSGDGSVERLHSYPQDLVELG